MIKFRQKEFFWMNALMAGGTIIGVGQTASANSEQQQANEDQLNEMQRHNKAMEKAAKANPVLANSVQEAKQFTAPSPGFLGNAKQAGIDIWNTIKANKAPLKKLGLQTAAMGTAFAGLGYVADKGIQWDMKRRGETLPGQQQPNPQQKQFTGGVLRTVKRYGKMVGREMTGWGGLAFGIGMPLAGYAFSRLNKGQAQEEVANAGPQPGATPQQPGSIMDGQQQKQYSLMTSNGLRSFFQHPTRAITNALGMGFGGHKAGQSMARALKQNATQGGWVDKAATWMQNHKKLTAVGTMVPGFAVMGGVMGAGEDLVKKPLSVVDKNAFAYEKSQNQEVE